MPASTLCTIAWHATRAGAVGVADLGVDPKLTKQAEFLRVALQVRCAETFFVARVPLWDHTKEERCVVDFPMSLPHEDFSSCFKASPESFRTDLASDLVLPRTYFEHVVYKEIGWKAVPIGYFSDGVPHTKKDGFIAFYWNSLISQERRLICSLRKSDMCQCGCRGFCSLGTVLNVISWSFNAMANGVFPSLDYEQKEFTDESRKEQGGKPLADGHAGALVEFRADLLEFVTACGFKRWSSNDHPCFLCHCNKENLFRFPASISASSWEDRDVASYHQHVERALMRRRIHTPEVLAELNRPLACTRLSQ